MSSIQTGTETTTEITTETTTEITTETTTETPVQCANCKCAKCEKHRLERKRVRDEAWWEVVASCQENYNYKIKIPDQWIEKLVTLMEEMDEEGESYDDDFEFVDWVD